MKVKELEDILKNYDKDLIVSFGRWDSQADTYMACCDVEIEKDNHNNTLDITVLE